MKKETIKFSEQNLKINIQSVSFQTAPEWRKAHFHDAVELVYVSSGEICAHINNESISLCGGDIMLINSAVIHHLENVSSAEIVYFQAQLKEFHAVSGYDSGMQFFEFAARQSQRPYCVMKGHNELSDIFFAIKKEMNEKKNGYKMYVKAYIEHMVAFMYRNNLLIDEYSTIAQKAKVLLPVAEYVEKNFAQPISLQMLAELVHFSKFELCRKFKQLTGKTAVNYINYVRLNSAVALLKESKSISEAAFCSGFSSVQYFNRAFKQYMGCTPGEYRKMEL